MLDHAPFGLVSPPPTPESVATPLAVGAGSVALDAGVGVGKGSQLGGGRRCTNGREGHGQLTCRSGRVGVGEVKGHSYEVPCPWGGIGGLEALTTGRDWPVADKLNSALDTYAWASPPVVHQAGRRQVQR